MLAERAQAAKQNSAIEDQVRVFASRSLMVVQLQQTLERNMELEEQVGLQGDDAQVQCTLEVMHVLRWWVCR